MEFDVLVIGGGPAGAAAARTLGRHTSWRVGVVDRGALAGPRIGETIGAGVATQLRYLGLDASLVADGHARAWATAAAWGSDDVCWRESIFTGRGAGWHLDRARFDERLLCAAADANAHVLEASSAVRCERGATGGWIVEVRDESGRTTQIATRFLIDTTGRGSPLARQFGAPAESLDRLAAVVGFMPQDAGDGRGGYTLVEAAADGWWYSSGLPGDALVVAWMSDADLLRESGMLEVARWNERLAQAPHTAARVAGRRLARPLVTRSAATRHRPRTAGAGWIAAGDAAASFDPLAGAGIGFALHSGIHAARVANEELRGASTLRAGYVSAVAATVREFRVRSRALYAQERRWGDRPFWQRRVSAAASPRTSPPAA